MLDLFGWPQSLAEIIGELHGRSSVGALELADQADRIEGGAALGIAVAEIVGEQRTPAGAEADAALRKPPVLVEKIAGVVKISGRGPIEELSGKIGVQAE